MADGGPRHHLAQFNIGRMRRPRGSPEMATYAETLDRVLPVALEWPGFVWIMDDEIVPLAERRFGKDFAANLSVWTSIESLRCFMSCPPHAAAMDRREDWFVPLEKATFVLWWVAANDHPDFAEACRRLESLRRGGPSADAFTLEAPFPPPV